MVMDKLADKPALSALSRRSVLGAIGASLGAGVFFGGASSAFARSLLASADQFPGLTKIIHDYVAQRTVACLLAAIGTRQSDPTVIVEGTHKLGGDNFGDIDTPRRLHSRRTPVTGMATVRMI